MSGPMPERADVVVIGGGVVGVTTALYLARHGASVVLLEKGRIAGEQSSRNWGWIRKQGRDRREVPLMVESARLWQQLSDDVGGTVGFGTRSTTYLALDESELADRAAWLDVAQDHQIETKLLTSAETDDLLGRDDRRFAGALHTPSDMTAEPRLAIPAFAELAAKEGVTVLEGCAARTVERQAGRVHAVTTERGAILCDAAVLGGGAWSRTFLENLGIFIPQLAVRSTAFRTGQAPQIHPGGLGATGASVRRRIDGGYTIGRTNSARFDLVPAAFRHLRAFMPILRKRWKIMKIRAGKDYFGPLGRHRWSADDATPFEAMRVLDPMPDMTLVEDMRRTAMNLHPQLGPLKVEEAWAGLIDVTPDEVPIIDEAPGIEGLWMATGLSGHGFGLGPGIGQLTAQMVTGRTPVVDPEPFRLSRFGPQKAAA